MKALRGKLDFDSDLGELRALGPEKVKLQTAPSGHYLLAMDEYPLPGYQGPRQRRHTGEARGAIEGPNLTVFAAESEQEGEEPVRDHWVKTLSLPPWARAYLEEHD